MNLCNPGWSRTHDHPALVSQVLELQEYTTMSRSLKDLAHCFASVAQPVTSRVRAQPKTRIELILWPQA